MYHYEALWLKPLFGLKVLELGYNIVVLDMDLVVFKPIFAVLDYTQDLMVSSDCNREEHTLTSGVGGPNTGVVFAKASAAGLQIFKRWLAQKGQHGSWDDQWGLTRALAGTSPAELAYRTWGPPHVMASFCCHYCNGLGTLLGLRKKEWRAVCPKTIRNEWVLLHSACITSAFDGTDGPDVENQLDVLAMKRDALMAIWQLQMGAML